MEGTGEGDDSNTDRGIMFRSLEVIFDVASTDPEVKSNIQISMMEVYGERIR